jgi:hypothetical protein
MTRCSTGRATQKYKGGGTDLSDILETQGDIIYADSTLTAENLTISGTPGDVLKVSVSGVPEWGTSTSQWVTSGSDISYITGHVGIGTTTPDANLHVNGNAFVSSNLALGGVLSMGTVNVVARHTLSAITATGNLTPHTVIFDHPTTAFVTTANVSVGGELSVVGNVAVDTNTLFVDSVNNRVGIGTTTPGSTLDVNGSLRAAYDQDVTSYIGKSALGGITYGATFAHKDMNTQFRYALRQTSAGQTMINTKGDQSISFRVGDTEKAKITSGGDFLVDTNTLYVDASENRVGLGTTTPGYTLDVLGDINFSGALTQNGTTYGGGGSGSSQWVTSGNNIHYPTGDVGIGTTTPGYDLDVIGDINFSGNVRRRGIVQPLSGSDVSYSTVENAVSTWTGRTIDANAWYGVTWSPELSLFVAVAGSGTNRVATSPDGITWTGRTIDANNWIDVTWSPELSLFVAVAGSGTYRVATSPDGITWTSRTIDANKWNSVTWSPELSLFVAVAGSGTYQVATSPDGITWTGRTIDASSWRNVTWSPELSLFVAVASTGTYRVATSPDGITWTSRTIDANSWYGITWSPELSLFVAVATSGTNRVATSPDGIAWTGRTIGVNAWSGVTWSPELSLFVAVAISDTNRVATSPDGITWTSRTIDDANDWRSVTWSPELSLFVAVASNGTNRVATSNLGIPTPLNTPMAHPGQLVVDTPTGNVGIGTSTPGYDLDVLGDINFSGNVRRRGIVQPLSGSDVSYSTVENAVSTWTGRTIDANDWRDVTWSPKLSLFVAVASSGTNRVATSPDGITWTGRTIDANTWYGITWSTELSLFVAVANSGTNRVATSPDGITWTGRTITGNYWSSVTWSPELSLFVAVAYFTPTPVATSPDGITWTNRTIDTNDWYGITWSPELSLFVAVADGGTYRVATSPDGITWTGRTIDANAWTGITWSPELSLFVAVAASGTNRVATSPDGITWTGRTITASTWRSVVWSPELSLFVAGGTNQVATSPDGIVWTNRTIVANDWHSVVWSPELSVFVAVADSGTNRVATSNLGIPTPLNTPMALPGQLVVDTPTGNVGIGTTTPDTTLHIINPSTTSGARQYGLHIGGKGADIVPIINASAGGLTVNTVAGLEITSVDTNISAHGRHALIESVSAGSTYNTDIEFLARSGVGYMYSGGTQPATKQARIAHNGYIYARVGTSATGADYAELFEWDDGNPENEDRTGMTVKLMEGGKICITDANTSPNAVIGVISAIYGFLGNNHWDEWVGKYLKDSLGRVVTETVDMVTWRDEDDKEHTFTINTIPDDIEVPETATYYQDTDVPKLNPKYDKTLKYTERGKRKEWGAVGLVGRLRVLKTYPKSSRWIKLQDIDSEVEEYLAV